jgi:hypothetical protein
MVHYSTTGTEIGGSNPDTGMHLKKMKGKKVKSCLGIPTIVYIFFKVSSSIATKLGS